jgi:hypothetical protein
VAFAITGYLGLDGLFERLGVVLTLISIFMPVVELCVWWRNNRP